jgi:DNA-binding response OmpR family regulator
MSASNHPILIVEDSPDDFFFLERSFHIAEIQTELRHVDDGQKAIDYLQGTGPFADREAHPLPSLVLLDLKLPLKHGFEVLAWLRQQSPWRSIVVLILTSSSEDADVSKAYELGANAFLVKPTSVDRLIEIVRAVDSFWLRHNKFNSLPSS